LREILRYPNGGPREPPGRRLVIGVTVRGHPDDVRRLVDELRPARLGQHVVQAYRRRSDPPAAAAGAPAALARAHDLDRLLADLWQAPAAALHAEPFVSSDRRAVLRAALRFTRSARTGESSPPTLRGGGIETSVIFTGLRHSEQVVPAGA
jgi:hypothetical protein